MNEVQDATSVDADLVFSDRVHGKEELEPESKLVVTLRTDTSEGQEISRLAAELGLSGYVPSADALKAELQKIIFNLHPDKSGGEFRSDPDKARFMKARRVVELLDPARLEAKGQSAAATQLPPSVRAISDARMTRRPARTEQRLHLRAVAEARRRISRHFAAPKIAAASVAALTLLVALPDWFESNPVLGPLLAMPGATAFLLVLAAVGAVALVTLWFIERSAEKRAAHLMSEAALGEIFTQARLCANRHGRAGQLSAWDLRRAIEILVDGRRHPVPPRRSWTFFGALDLPILETIAAIQMQRLIERKVLRELNRPSVELLYEISPLAMPV